jgi:hypothetical protein
VQRIFDGVPRADLLGHFNGMREQESAAIVLQRLADEVEEADERADLPSVRTSRAPAGSSATLRDTAQ